MFRRNAINLKSKTCGVTEILNSNPAETVPEFTAVPRGAPFCFNYWAAPAQYSRSATDRKQLTGVISGGNKQ